MSRTTISDTSERGKEKNRMERKRVGREQKEERKNRQRDKNVSIAR
jgi:hypothetical protein